MNTTNTTYKVIGLMSGTSLDGLDIAYCEFKKHNHKWSFDILKTQNIEYEALRKEQLKNAVKLNATDLLVLHNEYGAWLGKQTLIFIKKHQLTVDFIASHGHTIHHQPKIGLTYQIGSGQHIANISKNKVICDFRTNDVALHGQGAPLVPIGDRLLYNSYDFCLNLGGISNISFEKKLNRIAFDISPANMLLNFITNKINLAYDKDGEIARKGAVNHQLLQTLNQLSYYKKPYPKSLGYEWFLDKIIPIINTSKDSLENILHTAVVHIAEQITLVIKQIDKEKPTLLITGGGAKNSFLIEILNQKLNGAAQIIIPDETQIDYKEALIFAFMGVLKERNEINCLSSVTGAIKDSSSGVTYYPS